MHCAFVHRFGLLRGVTPTILNEMYWFLTGDSTVPATSAQQNVHARLRLALDAEYADFAYDLRHCNLGRPEESTHFWDAAQAFIESRALKAVDSRRHGLICSMAVVVSARDFVEQVAATLPPNTPIPSLSWVTYQF